MATKQNQYLRNDTQVAALAREFVQNATAVDNVRGTYLRILVAHALQELSKSQLKRYSTATALASVETVHTHLYAVVLEAVTTDDVRAEPGLDAGERRRRTSERNRRTTFARSSKSELANFVKAGGRLDQLTPETVTRDALRDVIRAARAGPASVPERFEHYADRVETALRSFMEQDADAAREAAESLRHRLAVLIKPPKRMTGTRRVGDMTLHAEQ